MQRHEKQNTGLQMFLEQNNFKFNRTSLVDHMIVLEYEKDPT